MENNMENNRKGDLAEVQATAWLWQRGYEVFRNMGCTGKIDIVAVKKDEILLIDDKSASARFDNGVQCLGASTITKESKKRGIRKLFVYNNHVSFSLMELEKYMNPMGTA